MASVEARTTEAAFEQELVHHLTQYGWMEGDPARFDPHLAVYPDDILGYMRETQADEYGKILDWVGDEHKTDDKLLQRITAQLDKHGSLQVLRYGIKETIGRFQLCQFKPSHGFNPDLMDRFHANRLRVVRQVPFDPHSNRTIDLAFFVNGIPVATAELKTEFTQSVRDAIHQYRKDRKPKDSQNRKIPLLEFKKRALVHFAVSTEEIHMTTRLQGQDTVFLPFNKGYRNGAGNSPNEQGYPVSYFWEEILARENWLDIIGRFIHLEKKHKHRKIDQDSQQLAKALENHTPIIVTILQKFPVVLERIGIWEHIDKERIGKGRYAVIVDEAHSSQTGKAAGTLKYILEQGVDDEEELTSEEVLNRIMESKGPSENISFFAFTATPKPRTIELFGRPDPQGKPAPFHHYSMRQAIEEGYILDVLQNYVTYKTFVRLAKQNLDEQDEEVDVSKAKRKLGKYVVLHPYNISQKIAVIVEHFREKVMHLLGGRAKAMVVTASREEAARYKLALDKYIKEQGYQDIKALVAFSGQLNVPDVSSEALTEYNMNPGLAGRSLEQAFEDEYQIMLVAEKFQTGFDQPLLCAMYVLKKLSGVAAVQTLGRLNRTYPGKKTFVIDFVNEADEIEEAFKTYYLRTSLSEKTDPNVVNDLADKLDDYQVYTASEVQQFAELYFNPAREITQGQLLPFIRPAKDRFAHLEEEQQRLFKKDLGSFVRAYDFLSMIVPYNDPELEKRCEFARRLNAYLSLPDDQEYISVEKIYLSHYRLQKNAERKLYPEPQDGEETVAPGSSVGTGTVREKKRDYMSHIVEQLNELFGGEHISDNDRIAFFESVKGNVSDQETVQNQARNNTFEQFQSGDVRQKILDAVIDSMNNNQEMSKKALQDQEARDDFINLVAQSIYNSQQGEMVAR